jgi:uroporphyrinogen decarboxylase
MTNRENALAVLGYGRCERVPVVHFGFWLKTVEKWRREGHLSDSDVEGMDYGSEAEARISRKLGFDFGWDCAVNSRFILSPAFERKVLEEFPDGSRTVVNEQGVVIIEKTGVVSIPREIDHLFKGRKEWEEHYKSRLVFSPERVDLAGIAGVRSGSTDDRPIGVYCGSLFGQIRDLLGLEGVSYLYADDKELYVEVINTVGELCYRTLEATLAAAPDVTFDFAHFWEDICFKNGSLVVPRIFAELVGPHYRRMTRLLAEKGTTIVSLDCDGCIDALLPIWLENGVNTMFPIEVGTWNASIGPWREKYGKGLLGVGGMNKVAFARDRAAIDAEIERLRALVDLGGFLPCPDHRIPPDAEWDNVKYYCDRARAVFG